MHILPIPAVRYFHDGETYTATFTVRANRAETRALFGRTRRAYRAQRALVRELTDSGTLAPGGCDCRHCRNDWDCCGRFILSFTEMRRARRGFTVTQTFDRNV